MGGQDVMFLFINHFVKVRQFGMAALWDACFKARVKILVQALLNVLRFFNSSTLSVRFARVICQAFTFESI
jgi:hypothetical protein